MGVIFRTSRSKTPFPSKVLIVSTIFTYILYSFLPYLDRPTCSSWSRHTAILQPENVSRQPESIIPQPDNISSRRPLASMIPQKLWYKVSPKGLSSQAKSWVDSCRNQNPTYKYELLTDESGDGYVEQHFANRPDIVKAYLEIPIPILKADLLRYMILFAEGGVWNDLDITCEGAPIDNWVPEEYKQNAGLVVGWEFDIGWVNFQRQFATWTLMAKPGSPHLATLIEDILATIQERITQYNVTLPELTYKMIEDHEGIVDFSGPRRLTRSIIASLSRTINQTIDINEDLGNLADPKLVGDVLILPSYAFAFSANHYAADQKQGPPLVTHHYSGTWKNDHGGEDL